MVFAVYFLPGYLFQPQHPVGGDLFNSLSFNLAYIVQVMPQVLLLLYLILRGADSRAESGGKLADFGLVRLSPASLVRAGLALVAIYLVLVPLLFGISRLDLPAPLVDWVHWRLTNLPLLPVVLVSCTVTGYSEELYFRAYLLTVLQDFGLGPRSAIAASTLLFALGHLYEGLEGLLGTAVIGLVLSLLFLRRRDLHSIALAHGMYNFSALLLSLTPIPF